LFLAANPKAPTLAFIHGGYRQTNDNENSAFWGRLRPSAVRLRIRRQSGQG